MTPKAVRAVVLVVCAAGIVGMIVTFGLITAAAVLGLILVSAVAPPGAAAGPEDEEAAAAELEDLVQALVREGADERAVRDLVRAALGLSRIRRSR
jgi:uncharacterized membrane protein (DUF2068 family)